MTVQAPATTTSALVAGGRPVWADRGRVPLARRVLFADRRRGVLTVAGVAAALLLVLTLQAVFAGAVERVTAYLRSAPADVIVSQAGVRTMHMSSSTLPPGAAARVGRVPGAASTVTIGFVAGAVLTGPGGRTLTYVVGYQPARPGRHGADGGPVRLVAGRAVRAPGEAVLDELAADQLDARLGTSVTVLGARLRVVGLTSGLTSITNTTVFVTAAQLRSLDRPGASYLLVRATTRTAPGVLAARLRAALPGTTVQTRAQFIRSETRVVTDMSADLLHLMALLGLLIGVAVIALGLLSATLARLREYAVLKALGASTGRLAGTVAAQAVWVVTLALSAAVAAVLVLTRLLPAAAPTVTLTVTTADVAATGLAALAAGTLAALVPLRRLARVDAATAFREPR